MKTDRNITLKDGTNFTLLKEDNILTFSKGVIVQSRYEEEIKEIGITEVLIIYSWIYSWILVPLIATIMWFVNLLSPILPLVFLISLVFLICWGLFGYFFVTETYPNVDIGVATEYEINHDKKKIVRQILIKQKFNIAKKDKGLNEVLKCMYGLLIIFCGILLFFVLDIVFDIVYLPPISKILISIFVICIVFLFVIFNIRYWKMPLNKPPEEEFPEWKYIGHMSANKLILICLMVSAVPSLVIHLLSLENILIDLVRLLFL